MYTCILKQYINTNKMPILSTLIKSKYLAFMQEVVSNTTSYKEIQVNYLYSQI